MEKYKSLLVAVLVTVLAATVFWAGTVYAATGCFPDTNGYWAETYICWMKDNGVTTGYPDGTYKPDGYISRGEMSVFLKKIFDMANTSATTKADTAETNAKAYADTTASTAETNAKAYADTTANTSETNAKTYADTTANTSETNAKTYADSLVDVPPSTGLILITPGGAGWVKFQPTDDISFTPFSNYNEVQKSTTGYAYLLFQPAIPTVLYGRSLQWVGVEFCYTASADVQLSFVDLTTFTATAGPSNYVQRFSDGTVRTDSACRYYVISSPVTLTADDGVSFYIQGNWTVANSTLQLNRTTFVFQATGTTAALPKLSGDNVVILQEGTVNENSPSAP